MKRIAGHVIFVIVILGLLVGIPIATHFDIFRGSGADTVSQATMELPDQPSGAFLVLINTQRHGDSMDEWRKFFTGEELPVIFDDIECAAASADVTALQLGDRYLAQLPENQMQLREENATLLVSKAEAGLIDVALFSQEMADALELADEGYLQEQGVTVIHVEGVSD